MKKTQQPKFLALEEAISQYWRSLDEHAVAYPLVDLEGQFEKAFTLVNACSLFQWQNRLI